MAGNRNTLTDADASALMDAVNLHLSRTVPAPMERMLIIAKVLQPTRRQSIKRGSQFTKLLEEETTDQNAVLGA